MTHKSRIVSLLLAGAALHGGAAFAQADTSVSLASADRATTAQISQPVQSVGLATDVRPHHTPPHGVPPRLHRKVLQLYKRIHNAYPDASRKRVFIKIAQVLEINPRRLWNLYHHDHPSDGPIIVDVRHVDVATDRVSDRVTDRARDRVRDRATDRPQRDRARDRVRDRPVLRDRAHRDRPVRQRPRGG